MSDDVTWMRERVTQRSRTSSLVGGGALTVFAVAAMHVISTGNSGPPLFLMPLIAMGGPMFPDALALLVGLGVTAFLAFRKAPIVAMFDAGDVRKVTLVSITGRVQGARVEVEGASGRTATLELASREEAERIARALQRR